MLVGVLLRFSLLRESLRSFGCSFTLHWRISLIDSVLVTGFLQYCGTLWHALLSHLISCHRRWLTHSFQPTWSRCVENPEKTGLQ